MPSRPLAMPASDTAAASGWLRLAAAPSFALMALLTADGQAPMICAVPLKASFLAGMMPMYLLMSIFHAGPWLTLITRQNDKRKG